MYKVLAKVLANRLKKVMDSIIGPTQMAFVKGHQIIDSVVIAEEIIHSWKRDESGGLLLKLDFKKAYNSVDHDFLEAMMVQMGFGTRWRNWMRCCVFSPLMSILVNGSPTKQFRVEIGLRQGDPLLPFLFNIVVEGLSCMITKARDLHLIKGAVFGVDKVHITHLQFADDTILFVEPNMDYIRNVKRILRCVELVSGLKINFHKSCLVRVGKSGHTNGKWSEAFRCAESSLPILYLGLPLGGNPKREDFWRPVINKVNQRLAPWKRGCISKGGRLILIRAVFSSLPNYFMSVFSIPVGVAGKIEKLQRGFFGGDGAIKRKVHAVDWDTVCKRKNHGGLGIGRVLEKGLSLLAKWIWRFGREDSSLWKNVICAKYGPSLSDLRWDWQSAKATFFFVKSVGKLLVEGSRSNQIFSEGLQVVVGNGKRVKFWSEVECDSIPFNKAFLRIFALAVNKKWVIDKFGSWKQSK
ncbi:hypothetical protein Dsin_014359 [Dipteronia sinensis]|uniref:Reverse transcriptase domain-containing protein n=1 Tax=Dipteronia sinensis TaxID=43782 RepID=A0AAE0E9Y4_9ROSI|nr:hypothetical protein Dsin_014359 [Dipteronia sinensis]